MEKEKDQEVQEKPVEETPEEVTISKEELEDLKKRADVSSQNFERLKKTEAEKEALETQLQDNQPLSDTEYSDEGRELKKEIDALKGKISTQELSLKEDKLYVQYPALKEHAEDFKVYTEDPENQGMPLTTMAKAYLIENDLLKKEPRRKGLEKPTGGKVTKSTSGKLSGDDAKRLRETNPRKYMAMIEAGTLEISDD